MPRQTSSGSYLATATTTGNLNAKTSSGTALTISTTATIGYVTTTTANTATSTITLTAPRTLIDWSTYEVGGGGTLTYDFGVSANDIVINRVTSGSISIDAGGTVQGMYNGHTGGNIWFLAPNGVFINGTVTAAGIVASTNLNLADTELLGSSTTQIMTDLAASGSLIDLSGVSSASGATIDVSGNIVLSGAIDAAGSIELVSNAGNVTVGSAATLTEGQDLTVSAPTGAVDLASQQTVSRDYSLTADTLAGDYELTPIFAATTGRDFTLDITGTRRATSPSPPPAPSM
jgi:filamentous hemagglutinin family protein